MNKNIIKIISTIVGVGLVITLSWAATVGIIWCITKLFNINFTVSIATGIWLIMILIKNMFVSTQKK